MKRIPKWLIVVVVIYASGLGYRYWKFNGPLTTFTLVGYGTTDSSGNKFSVRQPENDGFSSEHESNVKTGSIGNQFKFEYQTRRAHTFLVMKDSEVADSVIVQPGEHIVIKVQPDGTLVRSGDAKRAE